RRQRATSPRPPRSQPGRAGPSRRGWGGVSGTVAPGTISGVGTPSGRQTPPAPPAPAASITASAANGGGTKITEAFAPVFSTASRTVSNIGQPSCVVPPFPGVTPPTTFV